jgi:glycosyltransferase involved in cell wall biosynthesis
MRILLAIEDLRTGGAQVFGMRLAQALHERGHEIWLYSHYPSYTNHALVKQVAPDVPTLGFNGNGVPGMEWLSRKMQGLLRRLGRPFPMREQMVEKHLRRTLEQLGVQVVNSHMIKSDYVAAAAGMAAQPAVPLVITMHGCYEDFLHKTTETEVTLKSRVALQQASAVVYLTQKNLEIFSVPGVRPFDDILHAQIYNGFEGHFSASDKLPSRVALGIGKHDIVFGMVARGIAEKGWQYAVDSFQAVNEHNPNAHLVLVGSSEYLSALAAAIHGCTLWALLLTQLTGCDCLT